MEELPCFITNTMWRISRHNYADGSTPLQHLPGILHRIPFPSTSLCTPKPLSSHWEEERGFEHLCSFTSPPSANSLPLATCLPTTCFIHCPGLSWAHTPAGGVVLYRTRHTLDLNEIRKLSLKRTNNNKNPPGTGKTGLSQQAGLDFPTVTMRRACLRREDRKEVQHAPGKRHKL